MNRFANIDDVYDTADYLMKKGSWNTLDIIIGFMADNSQQTNIDILLAWATATLPAKSKIPSRAIFIQKCKQSYPDAELWKGLE